MNRPRPSALWRGSAGRARCPQRAAPPSSPRGAPIPLTRPAFGSLVLFASALCLTSCRPGHSVLAPGSPQATHTANLWWLFFAVTALVWLGVIIAMLLGISAREQPTPDPRLTRIVIAATTATVVTLLVLLVADFATHRTLGPPPAPDALTIKLTGHQWWWLAEYQDPVASNVIQVANELHVPVGRPILFQLNSPDVIHSFWIPSLQGKRDLIPGNPTSLWLEATHPGTYTGQCAEFCGYQHAHMGLTVVAEPPARFAAWQAAQRSAPPPPVTGPQRRGQQLFLTGSCVLCHTIEGTLARSRVGPPLTHLASQSTLGANTIANTRENLARWIRDPHTIKPGVRMPQNSLNDPDLAALLDYLATLK